MTQTIISADANNWASIRSVSSGQWSIARATGESASAYYYAGINYKLSIYYIHRGVIKFNTSVIGNDEVESAYLKMALRNEYIDSGNPRYDVVKITNSNIATWVADPDSYEDEIYDAILAGTYLNIWQTLNSSPSLNQYLNSSNLGVDFINKTGDTWLGVLAYEDRINSEPSVVQYYIDIWTPTSSSYKPQLIVNHSPVSDLMFWFI